MTKAINCHISDLAGANLDKFAAMVLMSRTRALTLLLELMNPGITAASYLQGQANKAMAVQEKQK